jgi:Uma2 family endonuclease
MPSAEIQLIDADTFLARGEAHDTTRREELIGGQIVISQPRARHQIVNVRIVVALANWCSAAPGRGLTLMPVDVRLSDWDVLVPDLVWYADPERVSLDGPAQLEPPDLVVEIRSPSTWVRDIGVKRRLYEEHGVAELWLVDPLAPAVFVYRRRGPKSRHFDVEVELGPDDSLGSQAMPGLAIAVGQLLTV